MEAQHVIVYTSEVAAFVDALETFCIPAVEAPRAETSEEGVQDNQSQEEICATENVEVTFSEETYVPTKRTRTCAKEQKEIIENLFEKQKAVVTEKSFMNIKGNKRFKSDVWSCFGDIKLLISRSEAKRLKIEFYLRQCGDEEMLLCKSFVGCLKCSALFIHDAQKSGTSTLRSHMRSCSRPKHKRKKGSPTIIFFQNKSSKQHLIKCTSEAEKLAVQEQILNFVLSTQSSFDTIDEPEFQKLLQMCINMGAIYGDVNIESMLCPQEKLTDFLLNDLYVSSINNFYTEIQYVYGMTFNANIWIEEQQKLPYISLICHYSTTAGELKSVILHTDEFHYESKIAEDVKEWYSSFINELPVIPFKRLILTDNQSNMVAAFKDEQCVRCAYQSLNLAMQIVVKNATLNSNENDFSDFAGLINGCKDLVTYFEQIENEYQLPETLKGYKEENWISVLAMFRSVNSQWDEILNILNETGDTHLLSIDKLVLSAVIELFQVFDEALVELSNGAETTLNIVIPWITRLRKHCLLADDDFHVIQQLKNYILVELNDQVSKYISVYHRVATLLDPRFKRLVFLPREDQIAANVKTKCLVKECMEAPTIDEFPENMQTGNDSVNKDRFCDLYAATSVSYDSGNSEKSAHREVDNYLLEPFQQGNQDLDPQNKFNPLKYWAQNSDRFPNLSKVAMWVLSCPASCIQTDETFSSCNWLVNCCRIHQRPENVNKTLFVKSYRKL